MEPAYESQPFVYPCNCTGHVGNVHKNCIQQWININKSVTCEICKSKYDTTIVNIPCSQNNRYKVLGYIICGNTLSFISSYTLWFQQILDERSIYDIVPIFVSFLCVLFQIIIWAIAMKNGNTYDYILVPFLWFAVFIFLEILLVSVSDIWSHLWDSAEIFLSVASIHFVTCVMMFFTTIYIRFRNGD